MDDLATPEKKKVVYPDSRYEDGYVIATLFAN